MSFDRWFRRYFALLLAAAVVLIAYFQANGIAAFVGAAIGEAPAPRQAANGTKDDGDTEVDGRAILARNPFDSTTGSLLGDDYRFDGDAGVVPGVPDPVSDPWADPTCDWGHVTLIALDEDPEWSFASIHGGDGKAKLRRVGDDVDSHAVRHLDWDRVWLAKAGKRCQMIVGQPPKATRKERPSRRSKRPARKSTASSKVPADMAAKITKVSDTQFEVERSVVNDILEQQGQLMRSTRMRPVKGDDGKVSGLKLSRVRNGTLMDVLGMKNGDELREVNGFALTNPQKALEAYGRLQTADSLSLTIARGGQPMTIEFDIK